jgi:hypothetical protein
MHYVWIKNMSALVCGRSKRRNKVYVCPLCVHPFSNSDAFERHLPDCSKHQRQKVKFPDDDDLILKWKSRGKTQMCPFVIYCDFESVLKPVERQDEIDGKVTLSMNTYHRVLQLILFQ